MEQRSMPKSLYNEQLVFVGYGMEGVSKSEMQKLFVSEKTLFKINYVKRAMSMC